MPFGTRLKNLLQARNLSQVNFANLLGITRGRLNNYIAGRSEPDYETLRSIAVLLSISTDYLLGLEKTEESSALQYSFSDIAWGASAPCEEAGPFTWIPLYEARSTARALEDSEALAAPPSPVAWIRVEEKNVTPPSFRQSYALLINDNSLFPKLCPNDIVFIRPMIYSYYYLADSTPEDLFAVRLHPSDKVGVSLKHCCQKDDILVMTGSNPSCPPVILDMQKVLFVPIMGKVISMTRSYLDMQGVLKQ